VPSEEAKMGLSAFSEIKQKEKISTDPVLNARIQTIGKRIAVSVGREIPNAQWEFVLFDSPQANAFCLPGGKVGVYTGILSITRDESGLATVIGHEVAHAVARHGGERMSVAKGIELAGILGGTSIIVGDRPAELAIRGWKRLRLLAVLVHRWLYGLV
jgi:predicted Zn-dependent protease